MPYQGSTQSVGFRNRAVSDAKATEAQSLAAALDKQRVNSVNEMEKVSRDQLAEMTRQDRQLTKNDEYEIKNLAKFSKTLNKALETTAKTVGKAYIDTKRQEGIDRARACHNGDESACAGIKLSEQQVNDIEAKIEEMRVRSTGTADKLELEAELAKQKLSLEERATALNIRKLGSNVAYGYRQGMLQERAKGYGAHLKSKLLPEYAEDGETRIDELITVTNELGEKVQVRLGDFDKSSPFIKNKIIGHVEKAFIELSDGGFNRNVVNKYLTKAVVTETEKFRETVQTQAEIDQAQIEKDQVNDSLKISLEGIDQDSAPAKTAIQDALNKLVSIERRLGGTGSVNERAKKALVNMIKTNASYLSGEGAQPNVDDIEDFLSVIENTEFDIPGLGKKNLSKFWPELNIDELRAGILDAQFTRLNKEDIALGKQLAIGIAAAQSKYSKDGDYETYLATIKAFEESNLNTYSGSQGKFKAALSWEPNTITAEAAEKDLIRLDKKYKGQIPVALTKNWPADIVEKYKDKIINPDEGITDSPLAAAALKKANNDIETAVNVVAKNLSKNDRTNPQLVFGITAIQDSIPALVKAAKANGDVRSNAEIIEEIGRNLVVAIGNQEPNSEFFITEDGVFQNTKYQMPVTVSTKDKQILQGELANKLTDIINSTDGDIFTNKDLQLLPANHYLLTDAVGFSEPGKANSINRFWQQISAVDPYERTPHELLNLERAKYGLPPIEWDETTQRNIDAYNAQNPEIRKLLKSGVSVLQERGIDLAGGISTKHMHSALIGADGTGFVSEAELPSLLKAAGFEEVSYSDYLNNDELQEKVQRFKSNQLINIALTKTGNKMIAIRMIAAARNEPLSNASNAMENWHGGTENGVIQRGNEMDINTAKTLNAYLSGNTENLNYVTVDRQIKQPSLLSTGGEIDYSQLDNSPLPTNIEGINAQITELENNEPSQYLPAVTPFHYPEPNPEYVTWKQRVTKLRSLEKLSGIYELDSTTKWTSRSAKALLTNIIGKEEFNRIVKDAGGYPSIWTKKDSEATVKFNNKMDALVKELLYSSEGGIE